MSYREELHDAIQTAVCANPKVEQLIKEGVLIRWVVVAEMALPMGDVKSLVPMSGNAAGSALHSWDQVGILGKVFAGELLRQPGIDVEPPSPPLPFDDDDGPSAQDLLDG